MFDDLSVGRKHMLTNELPVLLFFVMAVAMAVGTLVLAHLLGPRRVNPVKQMPYESGMDPIRDARQRFDVRFYLVAIAFLVFDVELLFLYPWAVASGTIRKQASEAGTETVAGAVSPASLTTWSENSALIFGEVMVFLALLAAAYVYAWRRGVFQWH